MEKPKFQNPEEQMKPKRREELAIEDPEIGKAGAAANVGSQAGRGKKRPIRKPWGTKQ